MLFKLESCFNLFSEFFSLFFEVFGLIRIWVILFCIGVDGDV